MFNITFNACPTKGTFSPLLLVYIISSAKKLHITFCLSIYGFRLFSFPDGVIRFVLYEFQLNLVTYFFHFFKLESSGMCENLRVGLI